MQDAVLAVKNGLITYIGTAADYRVQAQNAQPRRLTGIAAIPGILDVHHHIIEPFVKSLTGGEPAQMWRRIWLPPAIIPTVALPEIATAKQIKRPKKEGNMEKLRPKRISRTELYVRVWQTPMTRLGLGLELGISGNGLVMIA